MTLPAFSAAGSGSETAPAWPSHSAGDLGVLLVESAGGTVATPTGWIAGPVCDNAAFSTKMSTFYRFATSGAESAPSLSGGTNHMWGVILTYTGVNTDTPIHNQSVLPRGSSTSQSAPGVTTFLDDCMILHAIAWAADNAGPLSSGESNSQLGSLSERTDSGTVTNNGGGVIAIDGTLATHNSVQPTRFTLSTNSALACVTLALQAADKKAQTLARKSRIVNTGM